MVAGTAADTGRNITPTIAASIRREVQPGVTSAVVDPQVRGVVVGVMDSVSVRASVGETCVSVEDLCGDTKADDLVERFKVALFVLTVIAMPKAQPDGNVGDV